MNTTKRFVVSFVCLLGAARAVVAQPDEFTQALQTLASINGRGNGHDAAMLAWKVVAKAPVQSLPAILGAIDDSKPLGANWLRAAVDQIAERARATGSKLPADKFEQLVFDVQVSPRARRLAYEWLLQVDASAEQRIIPKMLNDSSLEMRRDAVALAMSQAAKMDDKQQSQKQYMVALNAARDLDQIDAAVEKLAELGQEVDLQEHFGFVSKWKLIGPFDNTDKGGFDVAYLPEKQLKFDAAHIGKTDTVKWIEFSTGDKYGMVDLNAALGKNMGAAGYAYVNFESDRDQEVDLRLGSICAAKVWLNGELRMAHDVYHSGTRIDQYVARGNLKKGVNHVLLKICQNEQTENWAQDWQFQFRICDELGTAILATNR